MTTRIQDAMGRLADRLEESDGRSVTYSQGSECSIGGLSAVPMDAEYRLSDGMGGMTIVRSSDWLIRTSKLKGTTPLPGDRIVIIENGTRQEFEVMPVGETGCWERHDNAGVMMLIHSNQIQ